MTDDRVYPASKPPGIVGGGGGGATTNPTFPANKAQLYSANRPAYRPPAGRRRSSHSRGCCCRCCCWTIFVIILLILLVAAASAVVYLIYRPQRPSFTVSSLKISSLNFTSATHLTTSISLSVIARNPNKNVGFIYDDTDITLYKSSTGGDDDDVIIGKGSISSFVHGKKNTTMLRSTIGSPPGDLDEISASKLKGDLKAKKGVAIKIVLNTKVKVKMGSLNTPKPGIRWLLRRISTSSVSGYRSSPSFLQCCNGVQSYLPHRVTTETPFPTHISRFCYSLCVNSQNESKKVRARSLSLHRLQYDVLFFVPFVKI